MIGSIDGASKSLIALAMASVLTACGGGGSSDAAAPTTDGGGNVEQPDGGLVAPEPEPEVSAIQWDANATVMRDAGLIGADPVVAISESGNIAAVWLEGTSPKTVWGRYYDKSSDSWSAATQLDKGGADPSVYYARTNPQIEFLGDTAVVVWDQDGVVYSSVYDDNGWSGNPQVIDGTGKPEWNISITAKPDDSGVVATYEYKNDFDSKHIRATEFSLVTRTWSEPVTLSMDANSAYYGIQMVTDPETGAIYAAWEEQPLIEGEPMRLVTATFQDGTWSSSELVDSGYFESVTIQADSDSDKPFLAWVTGGGSELFAARYTDGSWASNELNNYDTRKADIDSAVMADGDIIMTYTADNGSGIEAIYTHRLDVQTKTWGDRRQTDNEFKVYFPSIAADGNGRVALTYYQYNTWLTDFIEAEGWSEDYQPSGLNGGRENMVVMNEAGDAALIWRNATGGGSVYVLMGR